MCSTPLTSFSIHRLHDVAYQFTGCLITEPDHYTADLDGSNAIHVFKVPGLRLFSRRFNFNKRRKRAAYALAEFLLTIIKTVFADAVLTAPGFDCEPTLFRKRSIVDTK